MCRIKDKNVQKKKSKANEHFMVKYFLSILSILKNMALNM